MTSNDRVTNFHILRILTLTAITFLSFSSSSQAASFFNRLKSPYPALSEDIVIPSNSNECPMTPNSIHDMEYVSIYTDRSNGVSIVDKEAQKKYRQQNADIKKYERQIAKWIEERKHLSCVIQWLYDWSIKDSLLHGKVNFQGEATRKWALATLSSHYIQIRNLKGIDKKKTKKIDQWLERVADQAIKDYERNPEAISRNNNHMYWAAWAVMITGITVNNQSLYHWSAKQYKKAVKEIQEDGTLPLETYRQSKAFHYHLFATAPLVMMAETIVRNDHDIYRYHNEALHKLVNRIVEELETNQRHMEEITGTKQNMEGTITAAQLAWMEPYYARFQEERMKPWLDKLRPMKQRRIGGNMTQLYANQDSYKSEP